MEDRHTAQQEDWYKNDYMMRSLTALSMPLVRTNLENTSVSWEKEVCCVVHVCGAGTAPSVPAGLWLGLVDEGHWAERLGFGYSRK